MNRKQRRAAPKQSRFPAGHHPPASDPLAQLFQQALRSQEQNNFPDAVRLYRRLLAIKPDHAEANNNLGCVLLMQGKSAEASERFARALTLMPQLFEQFGGVAATLAAILPPIAEAARRAMAAWPKLLPLDQLLAGAGLGAIAGDPMLLCMLQSVPARSTPIERVLTSLRASLLADAATGRPWNEIELAFCCALARQCFINEFVFAAEPDEEAQIERLTALLGETLSAGAAPSPANLPSLLAAIAMYRPLHQLPFAPALLGRPWPAVVEAVLTQQLREPLQELALRASIPRLTAIEDEVSQRVRQQYEENPYPRWVHAPGFVTPISIDRHLREKFPASEFTPLGKTEGFDVLVAGCGTGSQSTGVAQGYLGARVLAVDLSLSSLCFAKRMTPPSLAAKIDYLQGDILKLGSVDRSFDMIDCAGVLHHMADPAEGWRVLLSLLRPGGIMHLGFYSELGRRDVVKARAYIAERGYTSSPADIRRCRQDLLKTPLGGVSRFSDFFSTSECRDLLLHVQESRLTIPAIKAFIEANRLSFIGFDLGANAASNFRTLFAQNGWSMTDLDRWHAVETQYPDTFSTMYQFWVQKPA